MLQKFLLLLLILIGKYEMSTAAFISPNSKQAESTVQPKPNLKLGSKVKQVIAAKRLLYKENKAWGRAGALAIAAIACAVLACLGFFVTPYLLLLCIPATVIGFIVLAQKNKSRIDEILAILSIVLGIAIPLAIIALIVFILGLLLLLP